VSEPENPVEETQAVDTQAGAEAAESDESTDDE
jgi:hypothetical protein